ncbi:lysis system i-spanin subunit Rz [Gilliamella sp. N-G2]|uniref:lysis system i-spanin subunit Rz n=1 Tax=Gilliamella sp. N-G2 TaxID=1970471 RepID=UPI000A345167|nr:lysis system i-spanin subunit Rz [Gilliamella sp. N-G2]OTQ71032.1 hypothetical protein B6C99_12550 [Gilliamella sp. N-G2]
MSKWFAIVLAVAWCSLVIVGGVANHYKHKAQMASARADTLEAEIKQYKADSINIKKLESNIIEAINHGQTNTDNLRNDIDNGLSELLVKVESAQRDSTTASNTAQQALRLAKSSQQDYYNLTNAINYNRAIIEGWQKYYCQEIAPKNSTDFMCN